MKGIDIFFKWFKTFKMLIDLGKFLISLGTGNAANVVNCVISTFNFIKNVDDFSEEYSYLVKDRSFEDYFYSHIGGLYMIDDDANKVYHCNDFFNEKMNHFICKNHHFKLSLSPYSDFIHNRNYLTKNQNILNTCQQNKLKFFKFSLAKLTQLLRRLDIANNKKYNFNAKKNRILIDIKNIQEEIVLFKEINFKKDNYEFCYYYKSEEILKVEDLLLIINPKNKQFFGEICLSQNIEWLINKDYDLINCYFINIKNPFSLKVELEKKIINENELYIYIKGKVSGTLELFNLSNIKILNISNSYYFPYINNFPQNKSINYMLPKTEENIYLYIIINDFGLIENKNISSIFEIYKNKSQIYYEKNYLILEKDNEYLFKYYPNQYELIINFINIFSNKFLENQFYMINYQNIYINYNIETKTKDQNFGLLFEFDGTINIKGYYSNTEENRNNSENYILNTRDKYFHLIKTNQFNYLNLDINFESELTTELKIYEFQNVIIINKTNSIIELNKIGNYMIFIDEAFQMNFVKFESYIFLSLNNDINILKLISSNGDYISSKNYLITKLIDIKAIFVKIKVEDIFKLIIISEEISNLFQEKSYLFNGNTFNDDKKYSIDFINNIEEMYVYYNSITPNLKIYELNYGSDFQLEEIMNYQKNNYSLLLGLKKLEEKKTHIILKESLGPYLYENYIDNLIIDLNNVLDISKIYYLFLDFEYNLIFNKKIKKILIKILINDNKQSPINLKCENEIMEIKENSQIINIEKCNSTFTISGNNSLIYFYLPLTLNDSYILIENKDNFELSNINQFFFVPKKSDCNSINILLTLENNYPIYLTYYIDYGIIPYSRNIDKKRILIKNETNIIIPNYSNYSNEDEKYFIFIKFNRTISKLNSKIIYENIIYLDDQKYLILKPGNHSIKFKRDIDYYLNITKLNKNEKNSFYLIYKNEKIIEKNKILNTENIIHINEPSYNENIKLKIENQEDLLIFVSSEYFQEFSYISYNKNMDIKQDKNILNIKFNTTKYNSKLEYNIALIEEDNNINPFIIHQKFYENNLIYKDTIYSTGIEPIETNFSLKNFNYDKKYTIIAYGKENIRDNFNYFYLEPKTLLIIDPNKKNSESYNIINNTYVNGIYTSDTDNYSDNFSDNINDTSFKNKNKSENKIPTSVKVIIIILIVLGAIFILGVIIVTLIFFCKKDKKSNNRIIITETNDRININ